MLPVSKILVPVDFSERSVAAVHYARNLACHFHAELILVHGLPPIPYAMGGFEFGGVVMTDAFAERLPEARKELDEFLANELAGMKVTRIVLEGDPAQMIVEHAHGAGVDLIVIPTHGYGPFRRFLLGSVTAKVLHDADCPVLTGVHLEEGPILKTTAPRKILCAVDLGPQSEKVVRWADQMAQEFQGELVVVHAMSLGETHSEEMFDPEWRVALEERIREKLDDVLAGAHTKATIVTESGNPAEVVNCAAQRFQSDLAVIGRSEAAGMFGRLRTNAYSIIRQSPCPVVSV
ncbi:MAG: universal stress protein [Acidobacteriia bacterium]|nr:universal stress protein [Terriglobia bacterium]